MVGPIEIILMTFEPFWILAVPLWVLWSVVYAIQVSDEVFLIAHENGIYKYDHDGFSFSLWLPDVEADVLTYDDLRQYVYVANGEKVFMYNYNNNTQVQEVLLPYEVLNLLVQYNK